jgi:SpoVK/Ycf46/Vps4 family AAA+-type ATPase
MDAVLLFDEADGLFGQRSTEVKEAQDKFANTEAAYLLQAIEAYPGIAFLASNQRASIDNAFLRRIRFVVEFVKPDATERLEIWRRVTTALAGAARTRQLASGMQRLAVNVEATGAQIKHAVLNAAFMARREGTPLGIAHLLSGLERELAKDNRFLSVKERGRMNGDD